MVGKSENAEKEWWEYAKELASNPKFKPEALDGIRVLDVGIASLSAHIASSLLAELGAEVIKVEPPEGDELREISPFGEFYLNGMGLDFLVESRNKKFITLNLKKEEGREIFKRMIMRCDVVIESFQPGWMDSVGIGYRQLSQIKPDLIYLAFSAYGHFGPRAKELSKIPDSNLLGLANSGFMYATKELPEAGEPYNLPTAPGFWMGSYLAAIWGVCGVLLSLIHREKSGEGQMIDVTSTEAVSKITQQLIWSHAFGEPLEVGVLPLDSAVFSYSFYEIKDGYAFASGYTDANFKALVTQLEAEHLMEKYPTVFDRIPIEKQKHAYKDIQEAIKKFTFRELAERMVKWKEEGKEGVAIYAKVQTPKEVLEDRFWWDKGDFVIYKDKKLSLLLPTTPWRLSETPFRLKWIGKEVGENNYQVYKELLGFRREDLEDLKKDNII
ncbi:MAG: CoA transferase [Archaeoglobus sp.]|nr:CoA transferase [Archaeoglobus sp.]